MFMSWRSNVCADAKGQFPVSGPTSIASYWEGPWLNDTIGVVLMAIGWILLPISEASYGMYLCHLLLLVSVSSWVRSSHGTGTDEMLGMWTTPVAMLLPAIISFVALSVFCVFVRQIPKIGKWIMG